MAEVIIADNVIMCGQSILSNFSIWKQGDGYLIDNGKQRAYVELNPNTVTRFTFMRIVAEQGNYIFTGTKKQLVELLGKLERVEVQSEKQGGIKKILLTGPLGSGKTVLAEFVATVFSGRQIIRSHCFQFVDSLESYNDNVGVNPIEQERSTLFIVDAVISEYLDVIDEWLEKYSFSGKETALIAMTQSAVEKREGWKIVKCHYSVNPNI